MTLAQGFGTGLLSAGPLVVCLWAISRRRPILLMVALLGATAWLGSIAPVASMQKRGSASARAAAAAGAEEVVRPLLTWAVKAASRRGNLGQGDSKRLFFALGLGHAFSRQASLSMPLLPAAFSPATPFSPSGIPLPPLQAMKALASGSVLVLSSLLAFGSGWSSLWLPPVVRMGLLAPALIADSAGAPEGVSAALFAAVGASCAVVIRARESLRR